MAAFGRPYTRVMDFWHLHVIRNSGTLSSMRSCRSTCSDGILVSFDVVVVGCRQVRSRPICQGLGSHDVVCEGSDFGSFEGWGTVASWRGRIEGRCGP